MKTLIHPTSLFHSATPEQKEELIYQVDKANTCD